MRPCSMIILTALCLMVSLPAPAAENFTLHYSVSSGGFQAMVIDLNFNLSTTAYDADARIRPDGVLKYLVPWKGKYTTSGMRDKENFLPQRHEKMTQWRDDISQYFFTYDKGALSALKLFTRDNGKEKTEELQPEKDFYEGTQDILSATLQMMEQVDLSHGCASQPEVFDGKHRFRLIFTDKGNEDLVKSDYNIFSGPTRVCQFEMLPLKGYAAKPKGYYKVQETARAKGKLPRVWLAQLWPNGPYLPVKMMVTYSYGTLIAHLQDVKR